MLRQYVIEWANPVNPELLHQELSAALGAVFVGVSTGGGLIRADFDDSKGTVNEATRQAALAVLQAHNPAGQTTAQAVNADGKAALDALLPIIQQRIEWHTANPVTAQNAVAVLTRMQVEWVYLLRLIRAGALRL